MSIRNIAGQWIDISGELVSDFVKQYQKNDCCTSGDLQTWVILLCSAGF